MLYVIYAQDKADSLEKRLSVRPAHLARLQLLHDEGRLLTAEPECQQLIALILVPLVLPVRR